MAAIPKSRSASGTRVRGALAVLACLFLLSQFAAATHVHAEGHPGDGHPHPGCELCLGHGAAAPPPTTTAAGIVPLAIATSPRIGPAICLPAPRRTSHAPRAPPFVPSN
jgi:hypothetical protein